jgi:hypothetical protein
LIAAAAALLTHSRVIAEARESRPEQELPEDFRGKTMVFIVLPSTGVLFAFVTVFIASSADLHEDLFFAASLSIGLSSLMVSLGLAMMIPQSIKVSAVGGQESFGRAIASMNPVEVPILTAFIVIFLAIGQDSCLGECVNACYFAATMSFGAILGAAWATTSEADDLKHRAAKSSVSLVAAIVGLVGGLMMIGYL